MAKHHLVSNGYQKNFTTKSDSGFRLTIIDARTGDLIDKARSTASNWTKRDWNSFVSSDGTLDESLEPEWSRLEASALRRIREIRVGVCNEVHRQAIVNLFSMHFVRSQAMADSHRRLIREEGPTIAEEMAQDPEVSTRFYRAMGRDPLAGEIQAMSRNQMDLREQSNLGFVQSMRDGHKSIGGILNKYLVQVVESPEHLPGFVLSDVPVFHGQFEQARRRFGFADGLAIGDADLVIGPLSRRVLVAFTATRERSQVLTSKEQVLNINRMLVRGARTEVACHPDDTLVVQRLIRSSNQIVRRV
jgi:hypothetical protein